MSINSSIVNVGTAATKLDIASAGGNWEGFISVPATGGTIKLGGSDVTFNNGFPLEADSQLHVKLYENTRGLYAIVGSGTQDINILALSDGDARGSYCSAVTVGTAA